VRKDSEREYWIEKRHLFEDREYLHTGVIVYWSPWLQSNSGTQLLDPDPDLGEQLSIGKVLEDESAGIRIIPLQQADDGAWIDVAVVSGETSSASRQLRMLAATGSNEKWLWFCGPRGTSVTIEESSDLTAWKPLATLPNPAGDLFLPLPAVQPHAFLRVRQGAAGAGALF
jgi:hypothetical protein